MSVSQHPARVAIVTGGSRGIGRAVVNRLVDDGYRVVTCGRGDRPDGLPTSIEWVSADIADPSQCRRLVDVAVGLGKLAALVNNAGVQIAKDVIATTDPDWDLLIGVNCRGVFNMCRAAIPALDDGGGVIVNIGSIAGHTAEYSMALYNASKAFVHGLTRSIAVDHGPRVRCNAVSPGWITTELTEEGFTLSADPIKARRDAEARHPLGRLGAPAEVAAAVSWMVSDESAFLTGQCLTLDGGLTAASPIMPTGSTSE